MITVSLDEIQDDFAGYLHRVQAGGTLLVTDADHPLVEIKPAISPQANPHLRPYGLCAGEFTVPLDFDAPLPDDILQEFE